MSAFFSRSVFLACVSQAGEPLSSSSQRVQLTCTSDTPASTMRRASNTLCPNRLRPYRSRTVAVSWSMAKALRASSARRRSSALACHVLQRFTESSSSARNCLFIRFCRARRSSSRSGVISVGREMSGGRKSGLFGSHITSQGSALSPSQPASWPGQIEPSVFQICSGRRMAPGSAERSPRRWRTTAASDGKSFGAPGLAFSTPLGACGWPVSR